MPPRKRPSRARDKDLRGRPRRRKISPLAADGAAYVDYKDVELLRSFVSERAKIRAQRVSGNTRQQQREVARAIKTAREMALLEYARRPMTQRRSDKRRGPRPPGSRRPLSGDERSAPSTTAEGPQSAEGEQLASGPQSAEGEQLASGPAPGDLTDQRADSAEAAPASASAAEAAQSA